MIRSLTILVFVVVQAVTAFAQQQNGENSLRAWKRDTAIVLFSAVGGGILGLSTLSFYGEPQEHTSNVGLGALAGLAAGLSYIIWEGSQRNAPAPYVLLIRPTGEPELAYRFQF